MKTENRDNRPGRFGVHGGQYIPETLMHAVQELETAYCRRQELGSAKSPLCKGDEQQIDAGLRKNSEFFNFYLSLSQQVDQLMTLETSRKYVHSTV